MAAAIYKKGLGSVFLVQGIYFVVTGIWPVVNMASFITATGPKQDTWLVEMVGLLSTSVGLTYIVTSLRRRALPVLLGYSVSFSFLIMDLIYVIRGEIDQIYLLDAGIQAAFIVAVTVIVAKLPADEQK